MFVFRTPVYSAAFAFFLLLLFHSRSGSAVCGSDAPDTSATSWRSGNAIAEMVHRRPALHDYSPTRNDFALSKRLIYDKKAGLAICVLGTVLVGIGGYLVYSMYDNAYKTGGRVSVFTLFAPGMYAILGGTAIGIGIDLLRPDKPKMQSVD